MNGSVRWGNARGETGAAAGGRDGERVGVVGECPWRTGAAAWGRADGIQDGSWLRSPQLTWRSH